MADADEILGFSNIRREADGELYGTAHRKSGKTERTTIRISVEREHRRADGSLVSSGEVASSDDASLTITEGASV